MKKILFYSDFHGHLPKITEECDLFLFAGDFSKHSGDHNLNDQVNYYVNEVLPWLEKIPAKHIVCTLGNHDMFADEEFVNTYSGPEPLGPLVGKIKKIKSPDNVTILINETWRHDEYPIIYGDPYTSSNGCYQWHAFKRSPTELENNNKKIPYDVDVMLMHSPPVNILDNSIKNKNNHGRDDILPYLKQNNISPQLYVCGHFHESFGTKEHNDMLVINAAYVGTPCIELKRYYIGSWDSNNKKFLMETIIPISN